MKKLLAVFAHPDDESYMAAGTIAKYVKSDWSAHLVCVTSGESAPRGEYAAMTPDEFIALRKKELESAVSHTGVAAVTFLDYKDGEVSALPPGKLEEKLINIFHEQQPDVVITMEPSGVTNNPDNVKVSLALTFAFQKYAFDRNTVNADDPNPPKLYYACMPESIVSYFVRQKYLPAESYGRPWRGVEDKRISTVIDIKRFKGIKAEALAEYQSQAEEIGPYLMIPNNPFFSQEYFILRYVGLTEAFMGKNDRVADRL